MISRLDTIITNTTYAVGSSHDAVVSRWLVSTVLTGGTYTIKPQKRLTGSGHAFADCAYTLALNNSAAGGTAIIAGTTQTTNVIMDVEAAGCELQMAVTVAGGGSLSIGCTPLLG